MTKQVSILGCGWLGYPLAVHLQSIGYNLKGSTTTPQKLQLLNKAKIEGYVIHLDEDGVSGNYAEFLKGSDTIIINIPPGLRRNPKKNHLKEIAHLIPEIEYQGIKNVLYISSTSVFRDAINIPVINYKTIPNGDSITAQQLILIENLLKNNSNFNTSILRFSGLFDAQRHPGNYLSGKQNCANPEAPINLIHKHDGIKIISEIISRNQWNSTFNAAYPYHPLKKVYYTNYCKTRLLKPPEFNTLNKSKGKQINSDYLARILNFTFTEAP